MLTSVLVADIISNVKSPDHDSDDVLALINHLVLEIAGGGERAHGNALVPPLPDLYSSGDVTISADASSGSMPATFHRSLKMVFDSSGSELKEYKSHTEMTRKYYGESGDPEAFCLVGSTLWVAPSPSAETVLTTYFYRLPVDLVATTGTIDGIPVGFRRRLLFNGVSAAMYSTIEQGLDGAKPDTVKHSFLYQQALTDLQRALPAEDMEAINVGDSEYSSEYII